ncbi:MAG: PAS domain S-box protein [Acidobacteria bacterium]|nr:PAS domain S-box protein [Acidobacteriota bacterium]
MFGNVGLLIPPLAVCGIVLKRQWDWQGCHRLFWDAIAVGAGLWVVGHLGWAFEEIVLGNGGWLRWHTLFSLCGGILPLIALLARPHLGIRSQAVTGVGLVLASYGILAVFLYSYFVLVPSLVLPPSEAEFALFALVQINRGALATGLIAVAWRARRSRWARTYAYLAVGVTSGFFFSLITSRAIAEGSYQAGTLFDLAWIAPFASYAVAAASAPRSSDLEDATLAPVRMLPAAWAAVPVVLIPLIGYGALWLQPLGGSGDAFRALITALLTVAGLGFLTLRLSLQAGELQRADSRLRLLAAATEQTQDMILITRSDGRIEHANDAFVRAMGYAREELSQRSFGDLLEKGFDGVGRHIREDLRARGVWRGTLFRRRHDGSTFPAACTITSLKEAGAITYLVGVERDITEELRLQEQLVHTERLSAIGELVAGVAHEINNPLQTVVGSVELMLEDPSAPPSIRRDLETVRREAGRAAQIVRSLLAFVRGGTPERTAVDLNQTVRETVALREFQFQQKSIRLSMHVSRSRSWSLAAAKSCSRSS